MNRDNWQHEGFGFHWPDDLPPRELQHLDWIERTLGPKYLRAVPALIAAGISPFRHDQFNEIARLSKLLKLSADTLGSTMGYLDGKHIFEGMLDADADRLLMPRTAAGLCIFRLLTGVPLPECRVSKAACEIAAQRGFLI